MRQLITTLQRIKRLTLFLAILIVACASLTSCAPPPPKHIDNICSIFREYPNWYWDASATRKKWHLPISVLMAIIYQESHFRANAAPPRERILWIIPWKRPTSAYGYSQAVDGTWDAYKQDTDHHWSSRDAFGDAANFIGWFAHRAHERAGISMTNAYAQYLAYHEGIGGYLARTYRSKQWLIDIAHSVQRRAWVYRSQLLRCESSLPQKPWWHIW